MGMDKWVCQLRNRIFPQAIPMIPDQKRIRELEKKPSLVKEEKEILKNSPLGLYPTI